MAVIRTQLDTSTNKDLFKSLLRSIFDNTDRQAMVEFENVYKHIKVSDEYEREARMAGLANAGEVTEGEPIPIQDPKFNTVKDYTQAAWGTGYRITDRMKRFNKYDAMAKYTKSLGMVMRESKDVELVRMFNSPTGTTWTGFDTLALASGSHTTLDDAATGYDNIVSTSGAALSTSTLESALYYFDTLVDDQGQRIMAIPTQLVVCSGLRVTANELLRSDQKPHEFSNTINVYPDWDLKIFVYHRLTNSTAWFMIAKNDPNYDIKVFTSKEPDMVVRDAPDTTRDTIVTSHQYFTYGFGDPRMYILGNT